MRRDDIVKLFRRSEKLMHDISDVLKHGVGECVDEHMWEDLASMASKGAFNLTNELQRLAGACLHVGEAMAHLDELQVALAKNEKMPDNQEGKDDKLK